MQIQVQVENGEKPDLDEVGPFAYRSLSTISKIIANQTLARSLPIKHLTNPQNKQKATYEKYFREDLERVNEEFHDDGTVSYETKKVSLIILTLFPSYFLTINLDFSHISMQ